jgi:hypothetical protein
VPEALRLRGFTQAGVGVREDGLHRRIGGNLRVATLALRVVRRLVPGASELVENVEDLARGRSVDLERPEDIHEGGLRRDRKTGMVCNQGSQTLAELTGLDERSVRIIDEESLREAAKRRKTGVERLEVVEIAGSIHLQIAPTAPSLHRYPAQCYCTTVARNNQLDAGFPWNPGFSPTSPEVWCQKMGSFQQVEPVNQNTRGERFRENGP